MLKKLWMVGFTLVSTASSLVAGDLLVGAGVGGGVEGGSFRRGFEEISESRGSSSKFFVGWELNRHLVIESARYDLGGQSCCPGLADAGFESDLDGYAASALLRLPLLKVTPFVRAGLLAWQEEGQTISIVGPAPRSEDGTDLLFGAGVDIGLPSRFALRAEWERYDFSGASSNGFWASLLLRF